MNRTVFSGACLAQVARSPLYSASMPSLLAVVAKQLSQLATSYSPRAFEALEQRLKTGVPLPFVFYTA